MSLYEITGRLAYLRELIENEEISEEDAADTMEAILQEQEDGYENAVKWIRDIEADIWAVKAEAEKLAEKKKALEGRKERVKQAIMRNMSASGQKKVRAGIFLISWKNPPIKYVPSVSVDEMPPELLRVKKEFSATAAKEWAKAHGKSPYFHEELGKAGITIR